MRLLVTGGTGKVGNAVVRCALAAGHDVVALVRDLGRAGALLPSKVRLVTADVTVPDTLAGVFDGIDVVFNAMGVPEQWLADPGVFDRVNVGGSVNVTRAAVAAGVRRLVHTSTIDVFDAEPGTRFDETRLASRPKRTPYERSKQRAEHAVLAAAGGMEVVIVNSATVYGLGPAGSVSMERKLFRPAVRGILPAVPAGGFGLVFTESLAIGHLRAAEQGRSGRRYIVCDAHCTLAGLAATVVEVAGRGRAPLVTIPGPVAMMMAAAGEVVARVTRRPPPMAIGELRYLRWNAVPDSTRAQRELGWRPTPLTEGIRRTVAESGLV